MESWLKGGDWNGRGYVKLNMALYLKQGSWGIRPDHFKSRPDGDRWWRDIGIWCHNLFDNMDSLCYRCPERMPNTPMPTEAKA